MDFVSRCFFPKLSINEDPVTGSAHCEIAPYWAKKLNRNKLIGKQLDRFLQSNANKQTSKPTNQQTNKPTNQQF